MKTKATAVSILITAIIIGAAIISANSGRENTGFSAANNVSILDGKQIIAISAKGGYWPKITSAKAGLPTVIKMDTQGTFDCSSALIIPSLSYRKYLPPSGETLIDIPPQKSGATIRGLCAMGMYNFTINFN